MVVRSLTFICPHKKQRPSAPSRPGENFPQKELLHFFNIMRFHSALIGRNKASETNVCIAVQQGHCLRKSGHCWEWLLLPVKSNPTYYSLMESKSNKYTSGTMLYKFTNLADRLSCFCSKTASSC